MKDVILNVGAHGLGDCLLSLQISKSLSEIKIPHKNILSCREEIFSAIEHLFSSKFSIDKIDENFSIDNEIEKNPAKLNFIKEKYNSDDVTYNVPDLLFCNSLAFDYRKYGLSPQYIKKTRTLTGQFPKKDKIIYCGLCSNTSGYMYENIPSLLNKIAEKLPEYTIYFPRVSKWVSEIDYKTNFNASFLKNVFIDIDPKFNDSLDILTKSEYGIFTCNGPSHIAYHLGIPRLILDPQFYKPIWMSRWKEDYEECINITESPDYISKLVYNNIKYPQTGMLDRKIILEMIKKDYNNWNQFLFLKSK